MQYIVVPPTFLEAAGVDPSTIDTGCPDVNGKRGFDGISFLDVLLGKTDHLRDYIFAQQTSPGNGSKEPYPIRAVRDGRYKLVRNLVPQNNYWNGFIHSAPIFRSWEEDAKTNPALAERVKWFSHRPAEEFYDLQADPYELKNLADDPQYADIKARFGKLLDDWMAQQGDKGMETELNAKTRPVKGVLVKGAKNKNPNEVTSGVEPAKPPPKKKEPTKKLPQQ